MKNKILYNISARPLRAIEFILSFAALMFGLYVLSPWYVIELSLGAGTVFDNPLMLSFLGTSFVVIGAFALYGLIKDSRAIRSMSSFLLFMAIMFISLLRLINFGFIPIVWFFPLICGLIAGIIYIKLKLGDNVWNQQ